MQSCQSFMIHSHFLYVLIFLHFFINQCLELRQNRCFFFVSLLLIQLTKHSLFLRRIHLAFFAQSRRFHAFVTGSAHHVTFLFEYDDFFGRQTNFTAPRDSLSAGDVCGVSFPFARQQVFLQLLIGTEKIEWDYDGYDYFLIQVKIRKLGDKNSDYNYCRTVSFFRFVSQYLINFSEKLTVVKSWKSPVVPVV